MAYGLIVAILLSTVTMSLQVEVPQDADYDYEDDYYDNPEPINESEEIQETEDTTQGPVKSSKGTRIENNKVPKTLNVELDREELTTEKQVAKYEVTELVIDVPDANTRRIPIISNFTLTRPLNLAGVPKNTTDNIEANINDEGDEIINSILISDKPKIISNNHGKHIKGSNNNLDVNDDENDYFSNSKDSIEEEFDKEFGSDEDDFGDFDVGEEPKPSKGFKDHFQNFRKNIVNEFKSVVNKHKDGIHDSLRKIVNGPISFFSKLHRKSSDLAEKLHKAASRHKLHDQDDDISFHGVDRGYDDE